MARPIILTSGLLLLAAALAGCSGGDGASDTTSVSTQTNLGNTTVSGSGSVGPGGGFNASINGTDGNASVGASWSYDNRTGTISGNGAFVNVPFEEEEAFTLSGDVSRLVLNLSATGNDLTLSLRAPGCEDSACAQEVTTQSGKASMPIDAPEAGDYVAVLQLTGTGPVEADYVLEIATLSAGSSS